MTISCVSNENIMEKGIHEKGLWSRIESSLNSLSWSDVCWEEYEFICKYSLILVGTLAFASEFLAQGCNMNNRVLVTSPQSQSAQSMHECPKFF